MSLLDHWKHHRALNRRFFGKPKPTKLDGILTDIQQFMNPKPRKTIMSFFKKAEVKLTFKEKMKIKFNKVKDALTPEKLTRIEKIKVACIRATLRLMKRYPSLRSKRMLKRMIKNKRIFMHHPALFKNCTILMVKSTFARK